MLNLQQQVGSIAGKRALETWFQGKTVYAAAATPPR